VRLPDGTSILLRPIRPSDKPRLLAAFERLSPESRYRRFMSFHPVLSGRELRYFTEIDHRRHEAIVAIDPATGDGIGVARYIASAATPTEAEAAIAVVDDWQRRGVGSALLAALVLRAREGGIRSFIATVLSDNVPVLHLLEDMTQPRVVSRRSGVTEVRIPLDDAGESLADALRHSAAGRLLIVHPRADTVLAGAAAPTGINAGRSARAH
jgi:GNAT superfamily N-acetyltransferase